MEVSFCKINVQRVALQGEQMLSLLMYVATPRRAALISYDTCHSNISFMSGRFICYSVRAFIAGIS
jgi:hypothetical protein